MKNTNTKLFLMILLIFVLHVCVVKISFAQSSGTVKTMPHLTGMSRQQAETVLKPAGVSNYGVHFKENSDHNQDEKVFTQEPAVGKPIPTPSTNQLAPFAFGSILFLVFVFSLFYVFPMKRQFLSNIASTVILSGFALCIVSGADAGQATKPPTAPSGLSVVIYSPKLISGGPETTDPCFDLRWKNTADNFDAFEVWLKKTDAGTYKSIAVVQKGKGSADGTYYYQDFPWAWEGHEDYNVVYYYRVRARNSSGFSDYSNEIRVVTPARVKPQTPAKLKSPSNLTATLVKNGTQINVNLKWQNNEPLADKMAIERRTGASGAFTRIMVIPDVRLMSYVDSGLTGNTTYTYRLQGFSSARPSDYSNEASATTPTMQSTVPNALGRRLPDADFVIKQAGLKMAVNYKPIELQSNDGLVSAQDPQAGRMVAPGTTVTLTAYRFDPNLPVDVMWVTDMSLDEARKYLELVGLKVQVKGEQMTTDKSRVGKVARQDPGSENRTPQVPRGSAVSLWIYREAPAKVVVPNLVGLKIEDAKAALDKLTLKGNLTGYRAATHQISNMTVAAQTPGPGTSVPSGSAVSFEGYFYDPQKLPKVAVPKMVNITTDQARTALANVGLQWSTSYRGTTNKADDGKVAAQDPQPGSLVSQGSIIKLQIYQLQTKK